MAKFKRGRTNVNNERLIETTEQNAELNQQRLVRYARSATVQKGAMVRKTIVFLEIPDYWPGNLQFRNRFPKNIPKDRMIASLGISTAGNALTQTISAIAVVFRAIV